MYNTIYIFIIAATFVLIPYFIFASYYFARFLRRHKQRNKHND